MEVESPLDDVPSSSEHMNCIPAWNTIQILHWYVKTTFPF